jgi:hypothetical protein
MLIPALAVVIGLNEAILLQQIHYWLLDSTHIIDGRTWIYNTLNEWHAQLPFWNERTLRRVIKSLVTKNLINVEQFNKARCDRTNWYSINYVEVDRLTPTVERVFKHFSQTQTAKATQRRVQRGQFVLVNDPNLSSSLT